MYITIDAKITILNETFNSIFHSTLSLLTSPSTSSFSLLLLLYPLSYALTVMYHGIVPIAESNMAEAC
jgi:hypothetical protein